MARQSGGWVLRRRSEGGVYYARWTIAGRTTERSTFARQEREAREAAARMYAHAVGAAKRRRPRRAGSGGVSLEEAGLAWLASLEATYDADTVRLYELYLSTHWMPRWLHLSDVTEGETTAYRDERLGSVRASTVRHELSALRGLLRHAGREVVVPSVPRHAVGESQHVRRESAPELSPDQVEALLDALPEYTTSHRCQRWPVRGRYIVQYETGLRSSTIAALSAPDCYRVGAAWLRVFAGSDKARAARDVPLSDRARAYLDAACPDEGLIFGAPDLREAWRRACAAALPPELARRVIPSHLRSARATHLLDDGAPLSGVQYLLGHARTSTTSIYVRPSMRAAMAALEATDRAVKLGAPKKERRGRARPKSKSG